MVSQKNAYGDSVRYFYYSVMLTSSISQSHPEYVDVGRDMCGVPGSLPLSPSETMVNHALSMSPIKREQCFATIKAIRNSLLKTETEFGKLSCDSGFTVIDF